MDARQPAPELDGRRALPPHVEPDQKSKATPEEDCPPPPTSWWKPALVIAAVAAVFAGLFATGYLPRLGGKSQREDAAGDAVKSKSIVNVVRSRQAKAEAELTLPGTTRPFQDTSIYARTNGYLERWLVDIGDKVTNDQLLAEIATPETDRELTSARAALGQVKATVDREKANLDLANANLARAKESGGAISKQDLDTQQGNADVSRASLEMAKANVAAQEATVARLEQLQSFQKIKAPFAGVITARNIDRGALISAGTTTSNSPDAANPTAPSSNGSGGRELFHIAQTETLRVFVNVPQLFTPMVKTGLKAELLVREFPKRRFEGKVTRSSESLDPSARSLATEVQVPNADNALRPGMYVQVKFVFNRPTPPVLVPAGALLNDAQGTRVGVIEDNKLHYRKVEVARDYGTEVEVVNGLEGGEELATNLDGELPDGADIQRVNPDDKKKKPEKKR